MRLQRTNELRTTDTEVLDPETATLRRLMARRRRRGAAVRRTAGAGALALLVATPAIACTNPAYGLELDADGHKAHASGWLDEDEHDTWGRPAFRITVDGKEIHKGRADGERRHSRRLFGGKPERHFDHWFGLTPGTHEICLIPGWSHHRTGGDAATEDGNEAGPRWCRTITVPERGKPSSPTTTPPTTAGPEAPTTTAPPAPAPTEPPTTAPPVTEPPTTEPPTTQPPAPEPVSWHGEMLIAVNEVRAQAGKPPVTGCANLDRAAQPFADQMAAQGFFDHTGPDGSTLESRTNASGYNGAGLGENIASGYVDVPAVMQGWMESDGHRANILGDYEHLGIGRNGNIWVQDFGSGGTC